MRTPRLVKREIRQLHDVRQLMKKFIRYSLVVGAAVGGVLSACSDSTAPPKADPPETTRAPNELVAQGPTDFLATVGTKIEPGPAVRVLDASKKPLAGVSVDFGSKVVFSDADGIARFGAWQMDTLARVNFIAAEVAVSPQQSLFVVFQARAIPGPVARFTASGGNNQVGRPGRTLPNQLHARATDIYNNPISGLAVSFAVTSGGGDIELASDTTSFSGLATGGRWTLGTTSPQRVRARMGDFEAVFDATFCELAEGCDVVPQSLAYVRDRAVWISSPEGPILVAQNASRPSWSPDGSRLAFFKVNQNREEEAICIASEPFSTSACAPVDHFWKEVGGEMRVSWSPDGGTLALSRIYYGAGNLQLLFLDVATMTIRRHGTIDGSVWSASWSPDGKKIAIASDQKVYLANAAGSDLEVLLPHPVWELAWAPDGQQIGVITLACPWECYGSRLALLNVQTKELKILENGSSGVSGLAWSPDGNSLAYSLWNNAAGMSEIRLMSTAGESSSVVLTNASNPSWRR